MNTYDVGDLVRVSVAFTDQSGDAVDPSVVTLKWRYLGGVVVTWVHGTDDEIVQDATGEYHADIPVPAAAAGLEIAYKWYGSGDVVASGRGGFKVLADEFDGISS